MLAAPAELTQIQLHRSALTVQTLYLGLILLPAVAVAVAMVGRSIILKQQAVLVALQVVMVRRELIFLLSHQHKIPTVELALVSLADR